MVAAAKAISHRLRFIRTILTDLMGVSHPVGACAKSYAFVFPRHSRAFQKRRLRFIAFLEKLAATGDLALPHGA
jgi:hypothetical protein